MYFLVVYDQRHGRLLELKEFGETERRVAQDERFARELKHANDRNIEVVLLGAESRQAIEDTHARYFRSVGELAARG